MKILLRDYNSKRYVWETAKYNNGRFHVNGNEVNQCNIVSIVNDNRKNYIKCSCCGQVFRKGDKRFQEHKENAIKPETCFGCKCLNIREIDTTKDKITTNPDGSFSQTTTRSVKLECTNTGWFSYSSINSENAIQHCIKRKCANATEVEINDFFTEHPGVFDDIITIDQLLDNGHDVQYNYRDNAYEYPFVDDEYTVYAVINDIGIIDRFHVYYYGDAWTVYYSKRYNTLFEDYHGYREWDPSELNEETCEEIKAEIAKLYR